MDAADTFDPDFFRQVINVDDGKSATREKIFFVSEAEKTWYAERFSFFREEIDHFAAESDPDVRGSYREGLDLGEIDPADVESAAGDDYAIVFDD